jgi:pimeloyl-ACP methyl ester carboxylesterase
VTVAEGAPEPQFAERLEDGRRIAFDDIGPRDGFPVLLLHGTPGSRRGPRPRGIVLHRLGIRLITYDRPGYGDSPRIEGRNVADAAQDALAIMTKLKIDRFGVVGRSGGGPHALACGADEHLRKRITRIAVLVSLAPTDAPDWYDGMNDDNRENFGHAVADTATLETEIRRRAKETMADPDYLLTLLGDQMTVADRQVVSDAALRRILRMSYRDALKNGEDGWIDDVLALRRAWKVDLRAITAPVKVWHGKDDTFAPAAHSAYLASAIDGAELDLRDGAAHFDAMPELPRILSWLATPVKREPELTPPVAPAADEPLLRV